MPRAVVRPWPRRRSRAVRHHEDAVRPGDREAATEPQRQASPRCVGRRELHDAQSPATRSEAHDHVGARRRRVEAAHAPGQLGHAAPRAVGGDGARLVDVARVHGREVERADVGRDARQQLVRGRHPRGRQPRQRLPVTLLDGLDERGQRGRRLRRTRPRRLGRPRGRHLVPAVPGEDDDQDDHEEQRKAGRPQEWTTGLRCLLVSQGGPRRRRASSRGPRRRRRCRGWQRGRSCRCRCTCRRG